MIKAFFAYYAICREGLKTGASIEEVLALPFSEELARMKEAPIAGFVDRAKTLIGKMEKTQEGGSS